MRSRLPYGRFGAIGSRIARPSRSALHTHRAPVRSHDAMDYRQAQTRSLIDILGGEERREHLLSHLVGHAGPGILNAQRNPVLPACVSIVSVPPSGMACMLLTTKLTTT